MEEEAIIATELRGGTTPWLHEGVAATSLSTTPVHCRVYSIPDTYLSNHLQSYQRYFVQALSSQASQKQLKTRV